MPRVIITAEVEDSQRWEEMFATHDQLFRDLGTRVIYYGTTDDNYVALCEEVDDLEAYFEAMESPAVAEAMAADGVKRETVKVVVLDKEWHS